MDRQLLKKAGGIFLSFCLLFSLSLPDFNSASQVLAKTSKSSKKKSSKRRTSKKRRSTRSSKKRRSTRKRSYRKRSRSSRSRRKSSRRRRKPKPKPKPLTAAQIAAKKKRQANFNSLSSAYSLYDAAVEARLRGQYDVAKSKLKSALAKMNQAKSYQKSGNAGTMAALAYFELGKVCELSKDMLGARDSYQKCLMIRPSYTPASVKLVNLLATYGHIDLARVKARDAVRSNPKDPRSHLLLSLLSDKKGEAALARKQLDETERLLSVEAQIIPKNNAKQANVVRVIDYLNRPKEPAVKPDVKIGAGKASKDQSVDTAHTHNEVTEDDAIEEKGTGILDVKQTDTNTIDTNALKQHDQNKAEQLQTEKQAEEKREKEKNSGN